MDLAKIILKGVEANKGRNLISSLENLPERTIQGDAFSIEAYWNSLDCSISLHVVGTKDELKKVKFNAPNNSKIFGIDENKLWFNYDGQSYKLKKYVC